MAKSERGDLSVLGLQLGQQLVQQHHLAGGIDHAAQLRLGRSHLSAAVCDVILQAIAQILQEI